MLRYQAPISFSAILARSRLPFLSIVGPPVLSIAASWTAYTGQKCHYRFWGRLLSQTIIH